MNLNARIWACKEILKRNLLTQSFNIEEYEVDGIKQYYNKRLEWSREKQESMINEFIGVCSSLDATPARKKAARTLLDIMMGKQNADDALDNIAIVSDRNDSLVRKWKSRVINRDRRCVFCESEEKLEAHHISHWADDPVNRINVDNGITLCVECHAKKHPEISNLILSKA